MSFKLNSVVSDYQNQITKLNFVGKIRDPLHNTIPYTYVEKIIFDRPEFQRLRRIDQTSFIKFVFPGATHSRFEHSIGAMHIAGVVYANLISNQQRILNSIENKLTSETILEFKNVEKESGSLLSTKLGLTYLENHPYLEQCLRFAALLHDCGHSPMSHSGERFMPTWTSVHGYLDGLKLPKWLNSALEAKFAIINKDVTRINHEIYSLLIVYKLFQGEHEFLSEQMGQDICSILDTSIPPYKNGILDNSKHQFLFHEIISGEVDVDRMDYLLRDSQKCGVIYGYFDMGRILDSLCFYQNSKSGYTHLAIRQSGISAYEDFLRARMSMYHQVYFHKTATACEAMLEYLNKNLGDFFFPIDIDKYTKLDDHNIYQFFNEHSLPSNKVTVSNITNDLLLNRILWKRVYEESIPAHQINNVKSYCEFIVNLLQELNIPCELIESSTNLTRFSLATRGVLSQNTFKVVLKNVHNLQYLDPIEKHCKLINRIDEEFILKRIFISNLNLNGEKIDFQNLQKLISKSILK